MRPGLARHLVHLLLLLVAPAASASGCSDGSGPCILGVFPHTSTRQVESTYSTIAEELSLVLDRDTQLSTSTTIPRFLEGLRSKRYDVAFAGLGHYIMVAEPAGYTPLARRKQDLRYFIIGLRNRGIVTLSDLKGRRLGMMPPENGTTIATVMLLRKAGIDLTSDLDTEAYGSQQACVHALLTDLVDACGVAEPVVGVFERRLNIEFQVIAMSPPLSNVSYIASPNLSDEQREALRDYFAEREGYVAATPSDYDTFRALLREYRNTQ